MAIVFLPTRWTRRNNVLGRAGEIEFIGKLLCDSFGGFPARVLSASYKEALYTAETLSRLVGIESLVYVDESLGYSQDIPPAPNAAWRYIIEQEVENTIVVTDHVFLLCLWAPDELRNKNVIVLDGFKAVYMNLPLEYFQLGGFSD